ncbi:MAG: FAD:protein FMN transferase [Longimicrobiales bacterium]|nr:FAD:protein FMN transferase [Longimicrobiales bacterium]
MDRGKGIRPSEEVAGISRRQALKITAVAGVSLALGGGLTRALLERARLHRIRRTRIQMGTEVSVTVVHPDPAEAGRLVDATFAEIERLEAILSRYRPGSPVSRLARDGVLHDAPPDLVEVLARARNLSERTEGAFDVTVAPLLDLYRARADGGDGMSGGAQPALPSDEEIEAALARVDYRRLRLESGLVALEEPGMSLTLDGIAKGYIVDGAVATLAAGGAERVLVEAGGDLATRGSDAGDQEVAIQNPLDPGGVLGVLRLRGEGVASSGDYVHAFSQDRRHHHILDPRTGRSPRHTAGVTVVAPRAVDADALSTAAFVLGPEEGLALLEEADGVEGLIVGKDGSRKVTRGLAHL